MKSKEHSEVWWTRQMMKADRRLMKAELKAVRSAVDKVAVQNASNDAKQNEWRQAMKDRESKYMTRNELWIIAASVAAILVAIYLK